MQIISDTLLTKIDMLLFRQIGMFSQFSEEVVPLETKYIHIFIERMTVKIIGPVEKCRCIFSKIIAGEIPCYKVAETNEFLAFWISIPIPKGIRFVFQKWKLIKFSI